MKISQVSLQCHQTLDNLRGYFQLGPFLKNPPNHITVLQLLKLRYQVELRTVIGFFCFVLFFENRTGLKIPSEITPPFDYIINHDLVHFFWGWDQTENIFNLINIQSKIDISLFDHGQVLPLGKNGPWARAVPGRWNMTVKTAIIYE